MKPDESIAAEPLKLPEPLLLKRFAKKPKNEDGSLEQTVKPTVEQGLTDYPFPNEHNIPVPHVEFSSVYSSSFSSEEKKMHGMQMDGQFSDNFDPDNSSADPSELHTAYVKNVVREFGPPRAIMTIRRRGLDFNIYADQFSEIHLGEERKGDIDDIEPFQTIRYQTDPKHKVSFLRIIAGIFEGKVQSVFRDYTTDGEGETTIIVEDKKKR